MANDKHTLYLIAEAGDEEQMNRFLAPFAQADTVELLPASPCEAVIDGGGCAQTARLRQAVALRRLIRCGSAGNLSLGLT